MRSMFCAATVSTLLLICSITASTTAGISEESKVTEVFLKADDGRPTGPCPLRVTFRGYITADGPATINTLSHAAMEQLGRFTSWSLSELVRRQ